MGIEVLYTFNKYYTIIIDHYNKIAYYTDLETTYAEDLDEYSNFLNIYLKNPKIPVIKLFEWIK